MLLMACYSRRIGGMNTDSIERLLAAVRSRQSERIALWTKMRVVLESSDASGVEALLDGMASSLEERRSQANDQLAKEVTFDGDND